MANQFQIDGNKSPTGKCNDRIKHSGLFWLRAYVPPALIGVQGISLCAYLSPNLRFLTLGLFLFSVYLFEGMGLLSPEDLVNQPERFRFFKRHKTSALLIAALSSAVGFVILVSLAPPFLRPVGALFCSGLGFILYTLFRWKRFGLLKPLLVSASWILALWGFSLVDFEGSRAVYLGLFLLLLLDSLWLDLKDLPGDAKYGFNVKHFKGQPLVILLILHGLLAGYFALFFGWDDPLFISNGVLMICGLIGVKHLSRWLHGVLVPMWSFYLLVISLHGY